MPAPAQPHVYRFGAFELRIPTHELHKHGIRLKLRPQPFQILKALLERPGEVVTREKLRDLLWSAETFVDFEHGLNTSIKELRAVLGDSAGEPRYIETLPKLGYRIVVPVESESTPADGTVAQQTTATAEIPVGASRSSHPLQQVPRSLRWGIPVSAAVVLIAGLVAYLQWSRSHPRLQTPSARVILAVLPFENLTGDAGQDYFSDGLTEEMIGKLGSLDPEHLAVIARTSVMRYKDHREPLDQVGRDLGVQYVLEGSVRRDANTVRVAAQLILLKDQTHLWSRQYDRELTNLLALQGEIAREISDEIQLTIGEHKPLPPIPQPTLSPQQFEAYDLYLKGLYFWNKRTIPGFRQAIVYFQQAIVKDSNSAPAHAGLANSYTLLTAYSLSPPDEFMPKARAAALRALEIDGNLAEAHTALALIVQNYNYDWQTAEKEYRRAIELNPSYATAHHWYAEHLGFRGRFAEAFRESERARQLDPLSLIIATDRGALLYYSRQYDRAIEEFRAVLEMDPTFLRAHILIYAYVEKGMFAEALTDLESMRLPGDERAWYWGTLVFIHGRAGHQAQALRALKSLEDLNQRQHVAPAVLVWAYCGVGDKDKAFAYLERAYSEHSNGLTTLMVEPAFDPLRNDRRFQDLLRRVGLMP